IYPPPVSEIPSPNPLNLAALSPDQARLWHEALRAESHGEQISSVIEKYQELLDSDPPENFAAMGLYSLGLLQLKQREDQKAAELFESLSHKYPNAAGESGLALEPLAELKLLELRMLSKGAARQEYLASLESFCSKAVNYP